MLLLAVFLKLLWYQKKRTLDIDQKNHIWNICRRSTFDTFLYRVVLVVLLGFLIILYFILIEIGYDL